MSHLAAEVHHTSIQWWYLDKRIKALGQWPRNALETYIHTYITFPLLLSSQCELLCGKVLVQPFLSVCLHHK